MKLKKQLKKYLKMAKQLNELKQQIIKESNNEIWLNLSVDGSVHVCNGNYEFIDILGGTNMEIDSMEHGEYRHKYSFDCSGIKCFYLD